MARFKTLNTVGFRNLKDNQETHFGPKLNFIFGENGAGKSNLLEALHLFSHSHSFRSASTDQIITDNEAEFTLFARTVANNRLSENQLGVYKNRDSECILKVNQQKVRRYSELASQIAVKTLSTERGNLLDLSPRFRRQEIDWQLFHMKHSSLNLFSDLKITLKQKNALLKQHYLSPKELMEQIEPWNLKLAELSVKINQARKKAIEFINQKLAVLFQLKLSQSIQETRVALIPGYPKSVDYQNPTKINNFLQQMTQKEQKIGQCLYGPQRADLYFFQEDSLKDKQCFKNTKEFSKEYYSRGQKKIISLYFSLAQVNVLQDFNQNSILCLDDLHAELDRRNFNLIIKLLTEQQLQCFITASKKNFSEMKNFGNTLQINKGIIK